MAYHAFMTKMQHPSASSLLHSMKEFTREQLREKLPRPSADEIAGEVQEFFQQMEEAVANHPLWAECDPDTLEKACDGVEKFVMLRLHDRVFAADADEVHEDEELCGWMRKLRFLTPTHLGIGADFCALQPWAAAQHEIAKISSYKTPRDKMVCILNCCKRINGSLCQSTAGTHGADEFFPILIYVLLQADAPHLHCNLRYIARFRHPSKLVSEAAYYLTHAQSALSFVASLTPAQLAMDEAEFYKGLQLAEQAEAEARAAAAESEANAAAEAAAANATAEAAAANATAEAANATAEAANGTAEAAAAAAGSPPRARQLSFLEASPQLLATAARLVSDAVGAAAPREAKAEPRAAARHGRGGEWIAQCQLKVVATGARTVRVQVSLTPCRRARHSAPKVVPVPAVGSPPKLRFLHTRSVDELTIGDVSELLVEYKWLSVTLQHMTPQFGHTPQAVTQLYSSREVYSQDW